MQGPNFGGFAAASRADAVQATVLLAPGIPMIFEGQEFLDHQDFTFGAVPNLDWSQVRRTRDCACSRGRFAPLACVVACLTLILMMCIVAGRHVHQERRLAERGPLQGHL